MNYPMFYNLLHGVFYIYKNTPKRIPDKAPKLSVNHSKEVMERNYVLFPYDNYKDWNNNTFIMLCSYLMFKYQCSSVNSLAEKLKEFNNADDFKKFLNIVKESKSFLRKDLEYLSSTYKKPSMKECIAEYKNKKIKFTTLYAVWEKTYNFSMDNLGMLDKILLNRLFSLFVLLLHYNKNLDLEDAKANDLKNEVRIL